MGFMVEIDGRAPQFAKDFGMPQAVYLILGLHRGPAACSGRHDCKEKEQPIMQFVHLNAPTLYFQWIPSSAYRY